jgi:phage terminase large subunit
MERDKRRNPEKYAHVWAGEYIGVSEARIFRNFTTGELSPPENVVWFYGVDWGFSVDATAALRCCIMGETLYIDSEAYEVGVPMEGLPKLLQEVTDIHKWPATADNARPETIDYCRRHGLRRMRAARKGKGSIEDGITFLQGFDVVINPRCPNVLNEFKKYAYKTDKRTGDVLPVVEDRHNHLIDALRYAVEGCHRKGKIINEVVRPTETKRRYSGRNNEGSNWKTM